MAGVQWSDGKMHGATEAKNSMMHDTKDTRLIHGHSNPDIDLTKTPNNMSYRGLNYREKCKRYDELIQKARIKRKSSGKNENVTLQKLVIPIPADMQDGKNYDPAQVQSWLNDVGRLLEEDYGELLIDIDCHVDEVHKYCDISKPKDDPTRMGWSRVHLHAAIVPAIWEIVKGKNGDPILDADGNPQKELVLNGYKFSQKKNILRLNKRIQEMTQANYGMDFMTGTGKGLKHNTVEDLKRWSAAAAREEAAQAVTEAARDEAPVSTNGLSVPHTTHTVSHASENRDAAISMEYRKKAQRQAEEEAKRITDQARDEASEITAAAKQQAFVLSQIALQQSSARLAQMRAKLELEAEEKEESYRNQEKALKDAQAALENDRVVLDNDLAALAEERASLNQMKTEIDAVREQVERDRQETSKLLAISRNDHLQQRRLNQQALATEFAAADRLAGLNRREENAARRERALKPVDVTYGMLKEIYEHERKSDNRQNASTVSETLRLIQNANSTPGGWLRDVENEYMRKRQSRVQGAGNIVTPAARPLPSFVNNMQEYS